MFSFILAVHTLLCLLLIGLVLIQQGKGADMGAAFGGGSNTVFGAGGAADFITRLTTGVAIAFMATSILLVRAYSTRSVEAVSATVDPLAGSVMEQGQKPEAAKAASPSDAVPAVAGSIAAAPVVSQSAEAAKPVTQGAEASVKSEDKK